MEETLLTWNFTNWVTVVLMAALGFLILALMAQAFHMMRGTGNTAPPSAYSMAPSMAQNNQA